MKAVVAALAVESIVIAGLLTVVADQVAHTRVERLGGVNIWGYRGPVLIQKRANEIRLATIGGDLAFSWGVAVTQTLAQSVRDQVSFAVDIPRGSRNVTAVTLGALGLAPSGYASWIERYDTLRLDVLMIVLDPSGHPLAESPYLPARRSVAFRWFGYSPILPLVLQEKGTLQHSTSAGLAGAALAHADALFAGDGRQATTVDEGSYRAAVEAAIRAGLHTAARGVVVVVPPGAAAGSVDRKGVKDLVASTFASAPVRVVDLGDEPAMNSPALRLDGFNFSTAGLGAAAHEIAPSVLRLLEAGGAR